LTKELFLHDHYLKTCTAEVLEVVDGKKIVLDRTVFYPQGGGQPSDFGELKTGKGSFSVLSVRRMDGKILHEVDREGLQKGVGVECTLDWQRRHKLMRFHTSAHLLAKVLFNETGALITGNQLEEEQSRMDFSSGAVEKEQLKVFEEKTNEVISQNLEARISFEKFGDAMKRPGLFRLKNVLPKNLPELRIVSIGEFDAQADGGTHVANTQEIGRIKILRLENKGKENRRIYWELE